MYRAATVLVVEPDIDALKDHHPSEKDDWLQVLTSNWMQTSKALRENLSARKPVLSIERQINGCRCGQHTHV